MMRFFGFIPNVIQDLVFCCVGFAANFSPSLAPCARTMVARSRKKMGAAFLQNSQLLNPVRYIPNVIQKLVFCCVGFAANFSPSLAPCARTMVARSRKKMGAAFLQNSQLLNPVRYIPDVIQKLVFCCVGFAANFSPSLAPCARTMVARSRKKIGAAFLQNSQLLNHVRYISVYLYSLIFFYGIIWIINIKRL